MEDVVKALVRVLLQLLALLAGAMFVASLLFAAAVLFALWTLRNLWRRLRGQAVTPWAFEFSPRQRWGRFQAGAMRQRVHAAQRARRDQDRGSADVSDAVPKDGKRDL
ncbi:MAG: hypothetical protein WCH44_00415 [Betaproteobacteria bacterium]